MELVKSEQKLAQTPPSSKFFYRNDKSKVQVTCIIVTRAYIVQSFVKFFSSSLGYLFKSSNNYSLVYHNKSYDPILKANFHNFSVSFCYMIMLNKINDPLRFSPFSSPVYRKEKTNTIILFHLLIFTGLPLAIPYLYPYLNLKN